MNKKVWIFLAIAAAGAISTGCRTTDKAMAVCEENNRSCHRGCSSSNAGFDNSKTAHQSISQCDIRCDRNYQACLKRQQDKNVRVIDDTPGN
ncbi:hypothetical protein [Turneriella parva]|uniref:Lipoprotein n=1 Tax=Turneriella parva (strain ATCC BAA-1111 / DSM 21527 / NCTC 11395 / H) TaxID=869212 RepID=I4B4A6_TURPD|nr:hypothetical protein [Turneriella parva]AFM12113.1 hypothetical protein Turpa_1465 [Turneriella parva DSM 21527]